MYMGTFLFGLYKFFLLDTLSWGKQDWCLLTAWMVGTGLVMDMDLIGLPFPVLIWGIFEVAKGAQVWLIPFWVNVCAPGQMIGLAKKWRIFLWLIFPIHIEWGSSRMSGDSPPMWFLTYTCRRSLGVVDSVISFFCWVKFNMYKFVRGSRVPFTTTFPLHLFRMRTYL